MDNLNSVIEILDKINSLLDEVVKENSQDKINKIKGEINNLTKLLEEKIKSPSSKELLNKEEIKENIINKIDDIIQKSEAKIKAKDIKKEISKSFNKINETINSNSFSIKILAKKGWGKSLKILKNNIILLAILTLLFAGLIDIFLFKTTYTVTRYAKIGITTTSDFAEFSPDYFLISKELSIIHSYFRSKDTTWIKNNFNLTAEESQEIKNLYSTYDSKHKAVKITVKGYSPNCLIKLLDNIAKYLNTKSDVAKEYNYEHKFIPEYIAGKEKVIQTYLKVINPSNTNKAQITSAYFFNQMNTNLLPSLNNLQDKIFKAKYLYTRPCFYYITNHSAVISTSRVIAASSALLIAFLLSITIILIWGNLKKTKEDER